MYRIELLEEPVGDTYRQLLSLAFNVCDQCILVQRDQIPISLNDGKLMEELKPYIQEVRKQEEWPGTQLMGHYADVYYMACTKELEQLLLTKADRLYAWTQPYLLDDLCFFRNGQVWLINVAHEQLGYIYTEDWQDVLKLREIDGLMFY